MEQTRVRNEEETRVAEALMSCRIFSGDPRELAAVRRFAGEALPADCTARDDFVLLLDEVAANAVRHTFSGMPGGSFEVAIIHAGAAVRAEVRDSGAATVPKLAADPDGLGEAGRGLHLVNALAKEWGFGSAAQGHIVWFEVNDPQCRARHP